jgi:uncharacterized protein
MFITREEAIEKMEKAGCNRQVLHHCIRVAKIAIGLAEELRQRGFEVDLSLVEVGAIMHDLGRSKTHNVEHGAVGGTLAREMGLEEALARIIERHVGAGITEEEVKKIGLPYGKYVPETLEEKIVAYADKLIEGDRLVEIEVVFEKFERELGRDHPALDRLRVLHEEMISLIGSNLRAPHVIEIK